MFFLILLIIPRERVIPLRVAISYLVLFYSLYIILRKGYVLPESLAEHLRFYSQSLKNAVILTVLNFFSVVGVFLMHLAICRGRLVLSIPRDRDSIFIMNLNVISLSLVVLYFESDVFVRLFRVLLFINIAYCINVFCVGGNYKKLVCAFYILAFSFYILYYFLIPVLEFTVIPLFKYNSLIGYF